MFHVLAESPDIFNADDPSIVIVNPCCFRSVVGNSISDHLKYFGIDLRCETWRQCTIVMSHEMDRFSRKDSKGNLVMSRILPSTNVNETEALLENGNL